MADGASSVSLNGLRSRRGTSSAIFVSMTRSLLLELNSTATGASVTVTLLCTLPTLRPALTVDVAARLHQDILLDKTDSNPGHFDRHRIRAGIDIVKEVQAGRDVGLAR